MAGSLNLAAYVGTLRNLYSNCSSFASMIQPDRSHCMPHSEPEPQPESKTLGHICCNQHHTTDG
ncbi:hypothetical protein HBI56_052230 [Parastagonospora nodorum]|uniref:Uncharacterized protein n=1 Tax=Phaeosphaeria nodorum (strain SN15 / ATCC MYA-4574 / FGSC 10173) TaxID=321614 RepID=A0A7U2ICV3_PHANO|nr:hypothetical protein HBH56_099930 [Parastagonospora nodorum]QRD07491.1 hypothetical protein JI435_424470 [Parastagonospora nodorum SN15]KAH3930192.1 hypothetical protein HBH54_114250 [Parastagonospora nodorum]KAH3942860.1 hypothetical protein HBH53_181720 [Parastagonospora nodorum]KAH3964532.1 hypothetical protein HBH51_157820 [Parastagonospora nodorum]